MLAYLQSHRLVSSLMICIVFIVVGFWIFRKPADDNAVKTTSQSKILLMRTRKRLLQVYYTVMRVLDVIPVIGTISSNITYEYQCREGLTEREAYMRTGRNFFFSMLSFVITFIIGIKWFGDILTSGITGFMIAHVVFSSLKSKSRKFLKDLNEAIEDFLLAYHKHNASLDAAFHSIIRQGGNASRHFQILYDYIRRAYVSDRPEIVQEEYNVIASSRYLRSLYVIIYMTYKYGDYVTDDKSAINQNIMELQEQIGDALYQQNSLSSETMGQRWFIIIPIYSLPIIAKYMLEFFSFEGFEYISSFLTSSTGYMAQVICALISLFCYLMYAQMADRGILEAKQKRSWENILMRNARIRKIVLKLLPEKSEKRGKLQLMITKAGSIDSVNALVIKQIVLAIVLFCIGILSISVNILSNNISINNNVYTGMPKENYTQCLMTYDDMYNYIDEMLVADKAAIKYLKDYDGYFELESDEQKNVIKKFLSKKGLDANYRNYLDYGIERIQAKMNQIEKTSGPINIVFVLLLTLLGYFLPVSLIYLKAFMNSEMLLLDEVNDMQRTTIMLLNYPSITPKTLLSWYASSSILLAPQLRVCKVTKDFETLSASVKYKPFNQLITSLELSYQGLNLKEAFSGVEQRLLTNKKEQSRILERALSSRIGAIGAFASISTYSVMAIYMFFPLMVAMIQMFMTLEIF